MVDICTDMLTFQGLLVLCTVGVSHKQIEHLKENETEMSKGVRKRNNKRFTR